MESNSTKNLVFGIFLTLLAYFLISMMSSLVKLLGTDMPTMEIILFMNLIPLLCLLPTILKKPLSSLKPIALTPHLIRDLGGIGSFFTYFFAIKYIGIIDATTLSYSSPFFIPIIWRIWAKEKIEREVWWAICLGFIGILFILKPGITIFQMASFIGILSALCSALALSALAYLNKKNENLTNTVFYNFLVGFLIALPIVFFFWKTPTFLQFSILISIGILSFLIQILLTKAYKHGTAAFLSPLSYSMIIYTALISWLFFKSPPGWFSLLGMLFVIVGGVTTYILTKKPKSFVEAFEADNIHRKIPWWKFWKK